MKRKLAAVGDNCMDVYESTGEAFPGGNPLNVAVYIRRMGGDASYTGVVGNDKYGDLMIELIKKKGIDISHLKQIEGKTAITNVKHLKGERILGEYDEGVMIDFKLNEEDITFLAGHDIVVSGIWGKVESYIPILKEKGTSIAFDFADKIGHEITITTLEYVDYAFFSCDDKTDEELKLFMKAIKIRGPKLVIVTRGEKGSMVYDGKEFTKYGIIECEVKDTMGAGDSYIAGFLMGIMKNESIIDCMKRGAVSSSVTIGYYGAW